MLSPRVFGRCRILPALAQSLLLLVFSLVSLSASADFVPQPAHNNQRAEQAASDSKHDFNAQLDFKLQYSFFHSLDDSKNTLSYLAHEDSSRSSVSSRDSDRLENISVPIAVKPWPASSWSSSADDGILRGHSVAAPYVPDVSDRSTLVNLAKMTSDAYYITPAEPDWQNISLGFNHSSNFGWDGDGLRGHVFADRWNKTVIVSFKGTTIDPREKWRANDRLNDNLLFSCCCGDQRPDPYPYGPVCGCRSDTYTCNATCITQEISQKDRYYSVALAVMYNVTTMFPGSDFWVVGHSMGGAVASLMGLTFGFPAVTFEAPGNQLPARRLGLDERSGPGAYHFGNTADPVFMGACTGWTSSCGIAGYAFESQCFTGKRCVYDTVGDFGWHMNIANHRINTVIPEVLEKYNETAKCEADDECFDCYNWKF